MKKITLGTLLLVAGVVGVSSLSAFAYKGDVNIKGPNYSAPRHDAMTKAFATKDYEAWKKLMGDKGNVSKVVTKDNFLKFTEMHNLMQQGKKVEAQKLRQELGLGMHNGSGKGAGRGMHR